jgi:hypothetical protein
MTDPKFDLENLKSKFDILKREDFDSKSQLKFDLKNFTMTEIRIRSYRSHICDLKFCPHLRTLKGFTADTTDYR